MTPNVPRFLYQLRRRVSWWTAAELLAFAVAMLALLLSGCGGVPTGPDLEASAPRPKCVIARLIFQTAKPDTLDVLICAESSP